MRYALLAMLALLAACTAPAPVGTAPVAARAPPAAVAPAAAVPGPAPVGVALVNAGFEAEMGDGRRCAPGWDCIVHSDPNAFRFALDESKPAAGRRSLCVERVANEPWALVTQAFHNPALRGARLRLSMSVRVDGATGEGAGPWILVQSNPPVNARRLVHGTSGWQQLSVEVTVPTNASDVMLGATMEGPGRACFDDARVDVLAPGRNPV